MTESDEMQSNKDQASYELLEADLQPQARKAKRQTYLHRGFPSSGILVSTLSLQQPTQVAETQPSQSA